MPQVGPPPGAPAHVRSHMPVVFFTARGIPGEVGEGMDSLEGALAACMRAVSFVGAPLPHFEAVACACHPPAPPAPRDWRARLGRAPGRAGGLRVLEPGRGHGIFLHARAWRQAPCTLAGCSSKERRRGGSTGFELSDHWRARGPAGDSESEEAEYAWLPVDCLKPFQPGDTTGNPDGTLGADGNLAACVAAADRAVVAGERAMAAAAAAAAAEGDAEALARLAGESDSDGGAHCAQHHLPRCWVGGMHVHFQKQSQPSLLSRTET